MIGIAEKLAPYTPTGLALAVLGIVIGLLGLWGLRFERDRSFWGRLVEPFSTKAQVNKIIYALFCVVSIALYYLVSVAALFSLHGIESMIGYSASVALPVVASLIAAAGFYAAGTEPKLFDTAAFGLAIVGIYAALVEHIMA